MDSADVRYLLWGVLIAASFWLLSLIGGGARWKRTLRSIGLAFGLGFIVFPDGEGGLAVKHVPTLLFQLAEHPYPIGQVLAASLGVAFWCIWLVIAFIGLGLLDDRRAARREAGSRTPAQEWKEPTLDGDGPPDAGGVPRQEASPSTQ